MFLLRQSFVIQCFYCSTLIFLLLKSGVPLFQCQLEKIPRALLIFHLLTDADLATELIYIVFILHDIMKVSWCLVRMKFTSIYNITMLCSSVGLLTLPKIPLKYIVQKSEGYSDFRLGFPSKFVTIYKKN